MLKLNLVPIITDFLSGDRRPLVGAYYYIFLRTLVKKYVAMSTWLAEYERWLVNL
jgi:hypothetical protein